MYHDRLSYPSCGDYTPLNTSYSEHSFITPFPNTLSYHPFPSIPLSTTVLALRDPTGRVWTSLPVEVKKLLHARLEELISHGQALDEPSIANVAAVSTAVGLLGGKGEDKSQDWVTAIETIYTVITNILTHPGDSKYYQINLANPSFSRRMNKVTHGLTMLVHPLIHPSYPTSLPSHPPSITILSPPSHIIA